MAIRWPREPLGIPLTLGVTRVLDMDDDENQVSEARLTPPKPVEPKVDPAPKIWKPTLLNFVLWMALAAGGALGVAAVLGRVSLELAQVGLGLVIANLVVSTLVYSSRPIPVTLRKAIRRLPVLRDPGAQRVGALLGVAATTCGRCQHFDLAAGQEMISKSTFGMAAQILDPSQMMKTTKGAWKAENGFDELGQPTSTSLKDKWSEVGACGLHRIGVFAPHSCKDWS